jgi:hypothetical protein
LCRTAAVPKSRWDPTWSAYKIWKRDYFLQFGDPIQPRRPYSATTGGFPFRKKAQPCQHATGELDVTPHQHIARQPQPYPFRWAGSGSPAPSCMVWLLAIEQNHDMVRPVRFGVSRVSGKMQRLHFFKVSVYFMCTYTCMYVFMCMCESGL